MLALQTTIAEAVESIALSDPISTVLFLMGGLFITASMLVFGGLSLGALADLVTPE